MTVGYILFHHFEGSCIGSDKIGKQVALFVYSLGNGFSVARTHHLFDGRKGCGWLVQEFFGHLLRGLHYIPIDIVMHQTLDSGFFRSEHAASQRPLKSLAGPNRAGKSDRKSVV